MRSMAFCSGRQTFIHRSIRYDPNIRYPDITPSTLRSQSSLTEPYLLGSKCLTCVSWPGMEHQYEVKPVEVSTFNSHGSLPSAAIPKPPLYISRSRHTTAGSSLPWPSFHLLNTVPLVETYSLRGRETNPNPDLYPKPNPDLYPKPNTYLYPNPNPNYRRYLDLIKTGAREMSIDSSYIAWLDQIPYIVL